MKNLINYLSKKSLSLGNGSGMTRKWFGNGSGMTRFSLVSLICVLMLTLGVGNAWGGETTYSFANSIPSGWSASTAPSSYETSGSKRGAQWGASSTLTLSSQTYVTGVVITCSSNNSNNYLEVKVGGTRLGSKEKIASGTTNTAFTFEGNILSGNLTISIIRGGNSLWIKSIKVVTAASATRDNFILVEDDLDDYEGEYLIVYNNQYAMYSHSGNAGANTFSTYTNISSYYTSSTKTITSNTATDSLVYVVAETTNGYSIRRKSANSEYLGYNNATSGGSNGSYLRWDNTFSASRNEWTIDINNGIASIVSVYNSGKAIRWNNTSGQYRFAIYAIENSEKDVQLFKRGPVMHSVTWMVNGEETTAGSPSNEVEDGEKVTTLPTTPAVPSSCSSKVFVGWTDEEYDEDDDPPSVLFTTAAGAPTVDDDVTYYAVFATSSGGGSSHYEKVTSTGDITNDGKYLIVYESSSTSAIIFDGSLNPLDASPDTIMAPISTNTISATSHVKASEFTIDMTNKYIKSASNKYIYRSEYSNGMNESTTANAVTSISISSNKFIVKGNEGTGANSGKFTTLSYNTAAAGASTYGSRFRFYKTPSTDIYLYKYVAGASYSAYATTCVVACAGPTAATKGSFNSGTQKMPINWTSAAGEVDICYSSSITPPGGTPGEGYTVIEGQTGSTSTSNTYNIDVSGLSAGNYYCWVRSVCDEDSKSSWTAITGDYFTIPGYTLTISPDPASSGTFDQTSGQTVVVGRTVSITATPAAGYNFTSWAVSGTGSSLSSTSTNPTTFTMGTANATVTATFTAKTLSSISLDETAVTIYDQQYTQIGVTYDPSDILTKGYTLEASPTKVVTTGSTNAQLKISATKAGVTITSQETETVSIKANADNTKTASVTVTINPLPKVHFVDLVHGKEFSDAAGTISENVLVSSKTTPTSADWESTYKNDCEEDHVHLVGWIRSDWPALLAYLAGTGDLPETDDITDAGNDGSGNAYYFTAGASINVLTFDGKTFYAVWAKAE